VRIAALTYTFGTLKTEIGLAALDLYGHAPVLVVAAPPVTLSFYKSKIRVVPRDIPTESPKVLARHYGASYVEAPHNSEEACRAIRLYKIDVAVILGARILKQPIIDSPKIGILNMHPGILPINRGLDTVKWAVLLDLPQGATAHLIDHRIDMGFRLTDQCVPVFMDDTLMDIQIRVQAAERTVMIQALDDLATGGARGQHLNDGEYRHSVPPEKELELDQAFIRYKAKRAKDFLVPAI